MLVNQNRERLVKKQEDKKRIMMEAFQTFDIDIDESRAEDYVITSIDYNIPSIKVMDKKNNTLYTLEYTSYINLLNYIGEKKFAHVTICNSKSRIEKVYQLSPKKLIASQMTFMKDDYELTFEKEVRHNIGFGLDAESRLAIRYAKNINEPDKHGKQLLLSRIFEKKKEEETFEQFYTYTYNLRQLIKRKDNQDKYCYTHKGNVIYGINNCEYKGFISYLRGVCFEATNVNIGEYWPCGLKQNVFPELFDKDNQSGIAFIGGGQGIYHIFTVFKTKNNDIYLKYEVTQWKEFKNEKGITDQRKVIIVSKEAKYPKLTDGKITSLEIYQLIERLNAEFESDIVMQCIIDELRTFAYKMDLQKGRVKEVLDPLSPKLLIQEPLNKIYALVNANKDEYFELMDQQFEAATNVSKTFEKNFSRKLKPNI